MSAQESRRVPVGRIGAVYGVRGWLRLHSYTEPPERIFDYEPWWLETPSGLQLFEIAESRLMAKGPLVRLSGVHDRDVARRLTRAEIAVDPGVFPALAPGEYYWYELKGLVVFSAHGGRRTRLGRVQYLLETGANDVLVVQGDGHSADRRERLIPYLPGQVVQRVDLDSGEMLVEWDPEF